MSKITLNYQSLLNDVLPEIIINRTFNNLPGELQRLYREQSQGKEKIAIGLDIRLGFYMLKYKNQTEVELVWSENQGNAA